MFAARRRQGHLDIWPGFVDALATLLMVIIFVLMTFVVSQLYLTDALTGREETILNLNKRLDKLTLALGSEEAKAKDLELKVEDREKLIDSLSSQLALLQQEISKITGEREEAVASSLSLRDQINSLANQLKELNAALDASQTESKEKDKSLKSLKEIGFYRSEFFSKLQKAIGSRTDIRIVGDRFVFQSEVLFDKASAILGAEGKTKLDKLVGALKDIASKIPNSFNWVLRVDGHTDRLPIHNNQFPSNWELSSARAIAVVKYLTENGIPAKHLVAAGFGEYQPMADGGDEKELARNRRIEFKLDQR